MQYFLSKIFTFLAILEEWIVFLERTLLNHRSPITVLSDTSALALLLLDAFNDHR